MRLDMALYIIICMQEMDVMYKVKSRINNVIMSIYILGQTIINI